MNHDRTRDEMPTPAHFSKLTNHRGDCALLQDDYFQISTFACMKPWKLLDSEFLVNAPWLKVAKEKCELPNGKVIDDFYTLWQPDWVLIRPHKRRQVGHDGTVPPRDGKDCA